MHIQSHQPPLTHPSYYSHNPLHYLSNRTQGLRSSGSVAEGNQLLRLQKLCAVVIFSSWHCTGQLDQGKNGTNPPWYSFQ